MERDGICCDTYRFQSTHPRGVRPSSTTLPLIASRFQSTHPRGVRLKASIIVVEYHAVSIHAPARGATEVTGPDTTIVSVSIHAPARGATAYDSTDYSVENVSIHAPARGATVHCFGCAVIPKCFNPRTREGCDEAELYTDMTASQFQSTHPRGVRL